MSDPKSTPSGSDDELATESEAVEIDLESAIGDSDENDYIARSGRAEVSDN